VAIHRLSSSYTLQITSNNTSHILFKSFISASFKKSTCCVVHCSESLGTVDFRLYPNFGKPHQVVAGINMTTTATKTTSRYVYVHENWLVRPGLSLGLQQLWTTLVTIRYAHMHVQLSSSATSLKFKQQQQVKRVSRRLFLNSRFLRCCCVLLRRTVFSLCCGQ